LAAGILIVKDKDKDGDEANCQRHGSRDEEVQLQFGFWVSSDPVLKQFEGSINSVIRKLYLSR